MLLVIARLRKDSLWSLNFYSSQFFFMVASFKMPQLQQQTTEKSMWHLQHCTFFNLFFSFSSFLYIWKWIHKYMKITIEDKMLLAGWKNTIGPKFLLICQIGQVFHRINTDSPTFSHTDPKKYCASGETKYRGSLFYMVFLLRYKKQTYIGIKPLCKLT